jgi:hypothetical protein
MLTISELAEQQRNERTKAEVRRVQRNLAAVQIGKVEATGNTPQVSIEGGATVPVINLGGVLRVGAMVLVQSDGINYWTRGAESL